MDQWFIQPMSGHQATIVLNKPCSPELIICLKQQYYDLKLSIY